MTRSRHSGFDVFAAQGLINVAEAGIHAKQNDDAFAENAP